MSLLVELGCRALPLPIVNRALCRLLRKIARDRPEPFGRMASYRSTTFLIEPVDIPVQFLIRLNDPTPIICQRGPISNVWDARIAGPIMILLAMVQGTLDGDALFFSREITIEGDTNAILALRNAIDAAEIDLPHELAGLFGPFGPMARHFAKLSSPITERILRATTQPRKVHTP